MPSGFAGDAMALLGASNFIEGEELTITVPQNTFADGARSANITHFITSDDPNYNILPELSIHAPWTVQVEDPIMHFSRWMMCP